MRVVAIIPARGGSKGVLRKNLRKVGEHTLIRQAVLKCEAARLIDEVYVSTESMEIAKESGCANIIARPDELATDEAKTDDAVRHAIEVIGSDPPIDVVAVVQCTAPLMTIDELDGTIRRLIDMQAGCAVAVAPTDALQVTEDSIGRLHGIGLDLKTFAHRRQEREQAYEICGSIWAMDCKMFLRTGNAYGGTVVAHKVRRRLEIDSLADLDDARAMVRQNRT